MFLRGDGAGEWPSGRTGRVEFVWFDHRLFCHGAGDRLWLGRRLAGRNVFGSVTNCFASGLVTYSGTSSISVGGLIGGSNGTVTGAYWDVAATGCSVSARSDASFGKTTAQMKQPVHYPFQPLLQEALLACCFIAYQCLIFEGFVEGFEWWVILGSNQ